MTESRTGLWKTPWSQVSQLAKRHPVASFASCSTRHTNTDLSCPPSKRRCVQHWGSGTLSLLNAFSQAVRNKIIIIIIIIILLLLFTERKILSIETILSARARTHARTRARTHARTHAHTHTHTHIHTHTCTNEHTDYTKFIHNLKTGSKQRLEIHEDSSMKSTFDPEYEINGTFQHEVNDFKFFYV